MPKLYFTKWRILFFKTLSEPKCAIPSPFITHKCSIPVRNRESFSVAHIILYSANVTKEKKSNQRVHSRCSAHTLMSCVTSLERMRGHICEQNTTITGLAYSAAQSLRKRRCIGPTLSAVLANCHSRSVLKIRVTVFATCRRCTSTRTHDEGSRIPDGLPHLIRNVPIVDARAQEVWRRCAWHYYSNT